MAAGCGRDDAVSGGRPADIDGGARFWIVRDTVAARGGHLGRTGGIPGSHLRQVMEQMLDAGLTSSTADQLCAAVPAAEGVANT